MSDKTEYKIVLSDLDGTLIIKGKDRRTGDDSSEEDRSRR